MPGGAFARPGGRFGFRTQTPGPEIQKVRPGRHLSLLILRVAPDDVVHELLVPGTEGSGFAVGQIYFSFQAWDLIHSR